MQGEAWEVPHGEPPAGLDVRVKTDPGGSAGMAAVPGELEDAVVEASEECPGECIFIERD